MRDLAEDRDWLDAFRAGDRRALERVFRTYARYVYAIIRRSGVHDMPTQDDLAQEVFVRVLAPAMRDRYDGLRPYTRFLSGVTRNVVADHYRKGGRTDVVEAVEERESIDALPDEALLTKEERLLVVDFVSHLDTGETAFVKLRFEEGRSQRDVADDLGLSRQRVRTSESKIRRRFMQFLNDRGFFS